MGFWTKIRYSWGLMLGIALTVAAPAPAQDGKVPWLLQPLEGPSRLALTQIEIGLDYRSRQRPGWAELDFRATVAAPDEESVRESLFVVNADSDSQVFWNERPIVQERLVMPVPSLGESPQSSGMARVSVFSLTLLHGERGQLHFRGRQPLDYQSDNRSRLRLLLPVRKSWRQVGEASLDARLAPELKLLTPGFSAAKDGAWKRNLSSYQARLVEVAVEAPVRPIPWGGAVLAVPALHRTWGWGALALLVALSAGSLGRRGWVLVVPLALGIFWLAWLRDPLVQQWTYYRHAERYQEALRVFRVYALPGLAALGALVLGLASLVRKKENA